MFSVAFRPSITFAYAGTMIVTYGLIALTTAPDLENDAQIVVTRLLTLAAVAFCGLVYWQIEHARRRNAVETRQALEAELQGEKSSRHDRAVGELAS